MTAEQAHTGSSNWWVTTGPLPGSDKIAGPFLSDETAFRERCRIELEEDRDDLWVQQEGDEPS